MIRFKYDLNQDVVELQASNWSGLERVFVNGQMVSHKLNLSLRANIRFNLKTAHLASSNCLSIPKQMS